MQKVLEERYKESKEFFDALRKPPNPAFHIPELRKRKGALALSPASKEKVSSISKNPRHKDHAKALLLSGMRELLHENFEGAATSFSTLTDIAKNADPTFSEYWKVQKDYTDYQAVHRFCVAQVEKTKREEIDSNIPLNPAEFQRSTLVPPPTHSTTEMTLTKTTEKLPTELPPASNSPESTEFKTPTGSLMGNPELNDPQNPSDLKTHDTAFYVDEMDKTSRSTELDPALIGTVHYPICSKFGKLPSTAPLPSSTSPLPPLFSNIRGNLETTTLVAPDESNTSATPFASFCNSEENFDQDFEKIPLVHSDNEGSDDEEDFELLNSDGEDEGWFFKP